MQPDEAAAADYRGNDLSNAISVGNRISELRLKAGLSAQDVEDYAGIKKANLFALEAGLLQLDAATAELLAMVLGVTVAELSG